MIKIEQGSGHRPCTTCDVPHMDAPHEEMEEFKRRRAQAIWGLTLHNNPNNPHWSGDEPNVVLCTQCAIELARKLLSVLPPPLSLLVTYGIDTKK